MIGARSARARLQPTAPEALEPAARAVHDDVVRTRAGVASVAAVTGPEGELIGPFAPMIASPQIGDPMQRVGTALREHARLPATAVETAILVVAQHWNAPYERYAHEAVARAKGVLDEPTMRRLRAGEPVSAPAPVAVACAFTRQLLAEHEVSDAVYAQAVAEFGDRGTVDLVLLIGYYVQLAVLLTAFRLDAPE
ncbi:MAG: carboxymuconolactone decarboxylase family protein [Pseudonocardiaceae bacterium]|nr:carboxymuconolactone decarboxylase family protein [Pseudonocardiaceae bacterium]